MDIKIASSAITNEQGLGPCYRIVQHTEYGIELYILPRSAIACDMELYDVDDPVQVLNWRLHGYRGAPTTPGMMEPSLGKAVEAQQLQLNVEYARARLAQRSTPDDVGTVLENEVALADAAIRNLKSEARLLRDDEVSTIKRTAKIADDDQFAALRMLVANDAARVNADRNRYREELTRHMTTGVDL
ncbi:hypothetical protein [Haloechinothrix salitolerans]|uniref:Uncharacterized protein n=1 Tax=Haloechinothrix salitolerans TaxID=926830 RepID=A0ABW2CAN4_9PSEU